MLIEMSCPRCGCAVHLAEQHKWMVGYCICGGLIREIGPSSQRSACFIAPNSDIYRQAMAHWVPPKNPPIVFERPGAFPIPMIWKIAAAVAVLILLGWVLHGRMRHAPQAVTPAAVGGYSIPVAGGTGVQGVGSPPPVGMYPVPSYEDLPVNPAGSDMPSRSGFEAGGGVAPGAGSQVGAGSPTAEQIQRNQAEILRNQQEARDRELKRLHEEWDQAHVEQQDPKLSEDERIRARERAESLNRQMQDLR